MCRIAFAVLVMMSAGSAFAWDNSPIGQPGSLDSRSVPSAKLGAAQSAAQGMAQAIAPRHRRPACPP